MNAFLLIIILFASNVSYSFEIPSGLTKEERHKIVKQLGIPSSTKFLSNPYPLGGYSGTEVGISYIILDTSDISTLGDQATNNDSSLDLIELSVGKGLYNNVDIFFNFAPLNQHDKVSSYGGILKWGFYQAKFLPINFSALLTGSVFHVSDSFVHQTVGLEVMSGVNVDNLSIYFGVGQLQGEGQFMGGANGVITGAGETAKESEVMSHIFVGFNFQYEQSFFSAQIDRYKDPTFSAKAGLRF